MPIRFKRQQQDADQSEVASVESYRNLNLLAHAQMIELEVGSRCGGHGICGGDRIRVTGDRALFSPITAAEREHLTEGELRDGWRLACQCWIAQDGIDVEAWLSLK